jgi:Flp pilus assembly pilin Flp
MKKIKGLFLRSTQGASSIEYAMIASLIAAVIVLAVSGMASKVQNLFQLVETSFP